LARAQIAMALTVGDGLRRCAELSASYAEGLARAAEVIVRDNGKREGPRWDRAAARALSAYRDYVRELAALPGIATMHYYDELGRLRAADAKPARPAPPVPAPTEGMLALATELAALPPQGVRGSQSAKTPSPKGRGGRPA